MAKLKENSTIVKASGEELIATEPKVLSMIQDNPCVHPATQAQAEAGTANDVYMTPLRVAQAFDHRVVFARVDGVTPGLALGATVTRLASSPTDYNTIKCDTFLEHGQDFVWIWVSFPSLGDVVVGTPQLYISSSSTLSDLSLLSFKLFETETSLQIGGISINYGIESFRRSRVGILVTRKSGTGPLNNIYMYFRFAGLKLA